MHPHARARVGMVRKTSWNMNNNIGLPLTVLGYDYLPQSNGEWLKLLARLPFRSLALAMGRRPYPAILVLEYGAGWSGNLNALARLAPPTVAVVTSIGPAHLECFGTVEGVAREKCALVKRASPRGLVILGESNEFIVMMERESRAPVVRIAGRGRPLSESIAYAVGQYFGLDRANISAALSSCKVPAGRLQLRDFGRVKVIDDVYNANPLSMKLGLDTLAEAAKPGQRKVALLGGMAELGEHSARYHAEIALYARQRSDFIVGVGDLAKGYQPDLWFCDSEECANRLGDWVRPDDYVLLKGSHSVDLRRVVTQLESVATAAPLI
jgi:UDP-N-acetylmuramoyl-tripeptide--D-alanyl-D-alanine ligase